MESLNRPILLRIPNDLHYIGGVLALAREVFTSAGFTESDASKIEIALEEAFTNQVRHSFSREEDATFELSLIPSPIGIEIRITDQGRPLNPAMVEEYHPETLSQGVNPKGLGSFLIKHMMDVVEYRSLGNQGKMLRMIKYLQTQDALRQERTAAIPAAAPLPDTPLSPVDFTIRRLVPEDAFQVSELAYETYGYSYLYEHIYYPDRITALNATGELISVVALTPDGELAAHVGMICDPELPGLGEMGLAMVKPRFRGCKLLEKISGHCIGQASASGIVGMYAQATTAHTFSQPVPKKSGMKPIGFILGYISPMNLKNIDASAKERVTPVVSFKLLQPCQAGRLYLPATRAGMVRDLLNSVSVAFQTDTGRAPDKDHSVYTVTVNPISLLARVIVYETGKDIVHVLKQVLVRIREESLEIGELLLNLNEPLNTGLYDCIESLGFIFTGILPGSSRGTFITLIYLNGINVHFDNIKLIEDNGQPLLAYIRQDYEKRFLE